MALARIAVEYAASVEGGRGHEAGAPTACIDDACALDPEAGLAKRGIELGRGRFLFEGSWGPEFAPLHP
jgi:hypothetical protein